MNVFSSLLLDLLKDSLMSVLIQVKTCIRVFVQLSSPKLICKLSTGLFKEENPEMLLLYRWDQSCYPTCSKVTIVVSYTIIGSQFGQLL